MTDDSTAETRRTVLRQSAIAGSAFTLGSLAAGSAAADQPTVEDVEGLTLNSPCTDETLTAVRGKGVFDEDLRQDQSGGFHGSIKLSVNATFEANETGQEYQGSLEASQNINVSADELPYTATLVYREKIISKGSGENFLAKWLVKITFNANGVETVSIATEADQCL